MTKRRENIAQKGIQKIVMRHVCYGAFRKVGYFLFKKFSQNTRNQRLNTTVT